jgi:hypothetical protein
MRDLDVLEWLWLAGNALGFLCLLLLLLAS